MGEKIIFSTMGILTTSKVLRNIRDDVFIEGGAYQISFGNL